MEFIPYLIVAAFAAMSAVMFNLYTRVRDLEDAIDEVDQTIDEMDADLEEDFAHLATEISAR